MERKGRSSPYDIHGKFGRLLVECLGRLGFPHCRWARDGRRDVRDNVLRLGVEQPERSLRREGCPNLSLRNFPEQDVYRFL